MYDATPSDVALWHKAEVPSEVPPSLIISGFDPAETSANQFCCIAQRRPETRKFAALLTVDVVGYSRLSGSEVLAQRLLGASSGAALGDALGNASNRQPDLARAA